MQRQGNSTGRKPADRLLTTAEVSGLLGVSVSSLTKWRLSGDGPSYVKMGNLVRYERGAVDAYIAKQTCSSTAEYDAA